MKRFDHPVRAYQRMPSAMLFDGAVSSNFAAASANKIPMDLLQVCALANPHWKSVIQNLKLRIPNEQFPVGIS
jgi:hypothetical protein